MSSPSNRKDARKTGKKKRRKEKKSCVCVCKSERDRYPCKNLNQSDAQSACAESTHTGVNRRFPEITGEDNLTVFSYSGRVKSPEWRWQRRRADLRHFEIFRYGPIIIYTRLLAGGTYYPICTFPTNSECLIGISDAFSAFVYGYPSSCPRAHCTPNKSVPTLRYTRIQVHARRLSPSAVPRISEHRLLALERRQTYATTKT